MNVVIAGSTRGIGLGMAQEFLKRAHKVMISSRNPDAVIRPATELSAQYPSQSVAGTACAAVHWLITGKIAGYFLISRSRNPDVFGPLGL